MECTKNKMYREEEGVEYANIEPNPAEVENEVNGNVITKRFTSKEQI